jgi:hypothetical protein
VTRQGSQRFPASVLLAYVSYFIVVQLGVSMGLPAQKTSTPFGHHIVSVVPVCAEKEMIRAHAKNVVAGVANVLSDWNFPNIDHIADSMRQPIFSQITERPVSIFVRAANPFPAAVCYMNIFQESQLHVHKSNSSHSINI